MSRFIGARELGLETEWRFRFAGYGEKAEPTPGVVYLDVGGAVKPGVLDHHDGSAGARSAAETVLQNREAVYNHLLSRWLERLEAVGIDRGTRWEPTIVTHIHPDWDSVVAAYLAVRLVEDGDFPSYAAALAAYSTQVDQGRHAVNPEGGATLFAAHLGYLAIQHLPLSFEDQIRLGLELVARVVADVESARGGSFSTSVQVFLPGAPGATEWRKDPRFREASELLEAEPAKFKRDLERATLIQEVLLPAQGGGPDMTVSAFVAGQPTESVLNKYWVRAIGRPLFVCPYGPASRDPRTHDVVYPKVIVSIDPNFVADGRTPTLRSLGFALEQAETEARRSLHPGIDDRGGEPRFPDGYCENSDPWYDGRAHGFTIVDSPNSGSVLPYARIVEIATRRRFWEVQLAAGMLSLVWVERGSGPVGSAQRISPFQGIATPLLALYEDARQSEPHELAPLEERFGCVRVSTFHRVFPDDICPSLRVVELVALPGASLEDLAACRAAIVRDREPDYGFSRVRLQTHFSPGELVDRLLRELGGGDVVPLETDPSTDSLVLFNGHTLVFNEWPSAAAPPDPDPDREVLLYSAFVHETLLNFSERISALVSSGGEPDPAETRGLREAFLRFQTRYYQLEVSRSDRGRLLYSRLGEALRLADYHAEVQQQMDLLDELEARIAEQRQAKADSVIEFALFVLAVAGLYQTIIAVLTWDGRGVGMLAWMVPLFAVCICVYGFAKWRWRTR